MPNIFTGSRKLYAFFLDLFFPVKCLDCGRYGEIICLECAKKIVKIKTPTCPDCGRISELGKYCRACRRNRSLSGIIVATRYDAGPVKEMIHHLKYSGYTSLSLHLGELIFQQIIHCFKKHDFIIVPVPLHKKRKNQRGFNQSELIARYVSERLGCSGGDALVRRVDTTPQVNLTRQKRLKNLENAFYCCDTELVNGQTILLIDDVATTGATLNECAKALRDAGAKKVWSAVVAKNI